MYAVIFQVCIFMKNKIWFRLYPLLVTTGGVFKYPTYIKYTFFFVD